MTDARKYLELSDNFQMVRGSLTSPVIAYETWGKLNSHASNAVLVFTGLSPSAHAASSQNDPSAGWWEDMIGPGLPIDTLRYFVICVNSLGSCFGSTGPKSDNPETGNKYRLDFPVLHLEDIARSGRRVATSLGVEKLFAVVGASMGGMTALAYTILYPGQSERLISISSAARSLPFSIALRSLQRELIRTDPSWDNGQYKEEHPPEIGMRLARKLGMITYRSTKEWTLRFGRERATDHIALGSGAKFGIDFEVEAYLQSHADKFTRAFDANCYLYLSRAMDLFDAADHGGSVDSALSQTGLEHALIVSVKTDLLFPPHQQKELADSFEAAGVGVTFQLLDSIQGHDSFLIDMDRFRPVVGKFF
jgi:homoserine O-acetyltransferase